MEKVCFLEKGKSILNEKFGIKPEKTRIIYCDEDSWAGSYKRRGIIPGGSFLPRNFEAYIPRGEEGDVDLPTILHEYFGHGLFFEKALSGKKLIWYEERLEKLERKILGKKDLFKKNVRVGFFASNEKKSRLVKPEEISKEEAEKIDYAFIYGTNNKEKVEEYLSLQRESRDFFAKKVHIYEGFACWITDFLIKDIDKNAWKDEQEALSNPSKNKWSEHYKMFKNYEEKEGVYSLWFNAGFPKIFREDILLNIIKEKSDGRFNNLKLAVLYGSKKPYSDIDFLLVFDDNAETKKYAPNDPDILEIKEKEFIEKTRMLDPQYTEPLLTGELVYGDKNNFRELKRAIKRIKPDEKIVSYLQGMSDECNKNALQFEKMSEEKTQKARYNKHCSLLCQSFSQSYMAFADIYKKIKKPLTLKEVLKHNKELSLSIEKVKKF